MTARKLIRELTDKTTEQQLFDYITAFLIKQGKPSATKEGYCRYRGPDGTMCAVGCIIPDSVYSPKMESIGLGKCIIEEFPRLKPLEKFTELLEYLQDAHDCVVYRSSVLGEDPIPYWKRKFAEIAKDFNLKFDPMLYKQL